MVQKMGRYQYLYEETPMGQAMPPEQDKIFKVRESYKNPPGLHGHTFTLTAKEFEQLRNGTDLSITTSYNLGHQHQMVIWYNKRNTIHPYWYKSCDGLRTCWDGHTGWFEVYA
jgi:hypothetical protein